MPYSDDFYLKYIATLDSSKYIQELKGMQGQTENSTNKMNTSFKNLGNQITSSIAGKMSLAGASVYLTRKFIQTTKEVVNFHKQISMVNTLLKVSKEELKSYGEKFEEIAIKIGVDKNEVVNAAYQSLSSGVAKKDLTSFLETASKTAIAGQATVEESVGVITSVINAYKMEMSEASNVADWLLSVQNKGVTTVKELGSQLGDVTSISSSLGITLNDLGGAIAQITQNGNNTAKTITMLKTMFSELSKEGQTASDNFKKISGQSFTEFIQNGGTLNEAMQKMEKYAKDSNISIVDLFSSVEAGSAALNLTGINTDKFNDKIKDITKSSGELENAYKAATDNIYYEWKKLTEGLSDEWNDFVKSIVESEALFNVVKFLRESTEDKNSKPKTINDYRKDLEYTSNELKSVQANISKPQGRYKPDNSMQNLSNQAKEQELFQRRSEIIKKINELEKQSIENSKNNATTQIAVENDKQNKLIELKSQEESRIKAHNETLSNSELNYLSKKKDYMSQQQDLLVLGIISQDEYSRNIKIKNRELMTEQEQANLESLRQMEQYYRSIDNIVKANEYKKKVIEVEIQIKENSIYSAENREDVYLQEEEEKRKQYQADMLTDEWEFLTQLAEMRENSSLTETEIETYKEERMRELELKRLELESEQLQKRLDFYNSDEAYKKQAVDTLNKIEENAIKKKEIREKKEITVGKMFSNLKNDIQKRSKDALLDTYDMIAKGQMKSLEDFKKFAALQLAEVMLSHGREAMTRGMSDTVTAISYATNPLTASLAPPKFSSAAKNFAFAAAMGVGANALYSEGESESGEAESRNNERTKFDDSIDSRVETSQKEAEGTVYIDVSDSQMAKVMIKQIEKELKDGYNVTLIGKKR